MELALQKTVKRYGPFDLRPIPAVTFKRATALARSNRYQNFFFKLSYEASFSRELGFVRFPIDLGIVGYRVCFTSEKIKPLLQNVESFEELKQFSHIQGDGWSDVDILRQQGFVVDEIANYESLFRMVAANRRDLFCRGVNELLDEYEANKHIKNLTYDQSMAIAYPLPRFLYTNGKNYKGIRRVYEGLMAACWSYGTGTMETA